MIIAFEFNEIVKQNMFTNLLKTKFMQVIHSLLKIEYGFWMILTFYNLNLNFLFTFKKKNIKKIENFLSFLR